MSQLSSADTATADFAEPFQPSDHVDRGSPVHSSEDFCLPKLNSPSDRVFCSVELVLQICRGIRSAPTGLGAFIRASLCDSPKPANVDRVSSTPLWPVPPVRWRWTGCKRFNPRRRRRHRFLNAQHQLLNVVICSLNWESLGFPASPPGCAQLGAPISAQQHTVIERLESLVAHFMRMPDFVGDDLGRAKEKFVSVIRTIQELPWCKLGFEDLTELALQVEATFDPYRSHFDRGQSTANVAADEPGHQCRFDSFPASATLDNPTGAMPVRSDRVKWKCPPSFDAVQFLEDPLLKSAFVNPEVLRKPKADWPKSRPAKVRCSKAEFLKLARRWDDLGACCLIPADEKDFDEAVGLFCVPKDAENDRLIVNPQVINSRMHSLASATKELAPGCLLTMLQLEPADMFRFNADDLSDYYYTFRVSKARAYRNAFRLKLHANDVRGFSCFNQSLEGKPLLLCLKTLAMGDNLAVEIAQAAHSTVLRVLCSAMRSHEVLKYRCPIPRSDFVELLAIDDHVGIQRLPIAMFREHPALRDTEVFGEATNAYERVGLVLHEKKRKRGQTQGVILGADFDGVAGRVMAPRHRILVSSLLSVVIAMRGTCTPKLLSVMLGCWVQGKGLPTNQPFCLSRQSRNELLLLAALGSTAQSDLRTTYSNKIYMTDASPTWGAVCQAPIEPAATAELWHHSEQRGFYTRLKDPAAAVLAELGVPAESDEMYAHDPYSTHRSVPKIIPQQLKEGILFDCCELFRGVGNWTLVHKSRGLHCHDGFNIDGRRLRYDDLADKAVFAELMGLAARGVVRDWHAVLPCVSFGSWRQPRVRSKTRPYGFNPDDPLTSNHNMLARRAALILTLAAKAGQFISVEQPRNSCLFLLHCFQNLVRLGCVISHVAWCCFGSAFQKASKLLHNKPWLIPLECSCQCPKEQSHFTVQGSFTLESVKDFNSRCQPSAKVVYGQLPEPGTSVAAFSASYPLRVVHQMASGSLAARAGIVESMPVAAQVRSLYEVGLADSPTIPQNHEPCFPQRQWFENPEWRHELCEFLHFREQFRYRFKRPGHINVNGMRTYKSWIKSLAKSAPDSRFVGMLDSRVTIGAAAKGRSSSYALTRVLKGSVAYMIGGGLYPGLLHCYSEDNRADDPTRYRSVRGPSREKPAWFLALERGDPTLFDAVCASAKFEKNPARWLRFLLLLAGDIEPHPGPNARGPLDLQVGFAPATAQRMDKCLQLFQDWCEDDLRIDWSVLTSDVHALVMALRAYGMFCFQTGMPRYPGSMSVFRRQWNAVMMRLGLPVKQSSHGATPGVLRGSGATYLYHQTEDLAWVAWRGRWSRTRTLEFYLQEVGAFVLVHSLDRTSRDRIAMLSKFAWPVLHRCVWNASSSGKSG